MQAIFHISVTANGKAVPVRIIDIAEVKPVGGDDGGSILRFNTNRSNLEVNETPAQIYTKINTVETAYLTALTGV